METVMGRRVFVGSMAASLPLLVTASTRGLAQSAADATHVHPDAVADPVLEHIARQLAAVHNAMRRDPRGEHFRAFAAQLRTLAVYGRQIGIDERLASSIRARIDSNGRDAFLYPSQDRAHLLNELRRYGVQPDERLVGVESDLDYSRRDAALAALIETGGLSTRLQQLAGLLERGAPEADRRQATVVRVSQIQYDAEYMKGYCEELWNQYRETQFLAAVLCASAALPYVGVLFAPECIAWQLAAMFFAMAYAGYCWN